MVEVEETRPERGEEEEVRVRASLGFNGLLDGGPNALFNGLLPTIV